MKAIGNPRYGSADDLRMLDVDKPAVGADGVRVRVRAASVNAGDWRIMRGEPRLFRFLMGVRGPKPSIRGWDVAGEVEAVGEKVTRLRPGDEVFGVCEGAFAEYASAAETKLVPKPPGLTFEQAAAMPAAGVTALQGLRDVGGVQSGQRVLVNGAAGGVGTFAVQIAKAFGAEVTGVCSTRKLDMVRSIGADHVIDYTADDFTRNGQRYDVVFDLAGNRSLAELRRAATPGGTVVLGGDGSGRWLGPMGLMLGGFVLSPFVGQHLRPFIAKLKQEDLMVLKELVEAGKVAPVIDRTYPLSEAAEAIRYLEAGHARGKVVITV